MCTGMMARVRGVIKPGNATQVNIQVETDIGKDGDRTNLKDYVDRGAEGHRS